MSNQAGTQAIEFGELQWLQVDDGWLVRLGGTRDGKGWFSSQFCPNSLRHDPGYTQWVRESLEETIRTLFEHVGEDPTC